MNLLKHLSLFTLITLSITACDTSSSTSDDNGTNQPVVNQEKIIASWWNAASEKQMVARYDSVNNAWISIGEIGDLKMWQGALYERNDTIVAYGNNLTVDKVYVINAINGTLLHQQTYDANAFAGIFFASGKKDICYWTNDNTQEYEFGRVSLLDGTIEVYGSIVDPQYDGMTITSAVATDTELILLVYESNGVDLRTIKISLDTKLIISNTAFTNSYVNPVFSRGVHTMLLWYNQTLQKQQVGSINLSTMTVTALGEVGDLEMWNGNSFTYGSRLYVYGSSGTGSHSLYILNRTSGALLNTVVAIPEQDYSFGF